MSYPHLAQRVRDTYAQRSSTTLKNSLYDSYKLALRWASDRIGEQGIIAFVTNGSFVDGNADAGLRACLADEFSHLYVFHLRGNQRTQGERSRQEGGKIFGSGSRAPVAMMVLVRTPRIRAQVKFITRTSGITCPAKTSCRGSESSAPLPALRTGKTYSPINTMTGWTSATRPIRPFMPLVSKEAKSLRVSEPRVAARSYTSGVKTSRDTWLYSFDPKVSTNGFKT